MSIWKKKLKRIEGEKIELELYVADVVDDHKIKMETMRLKIRKYVIDMLLARDSIIGILIPSSISESTSAP